MTALVFDCDGVLADTERYGHLPAFNATFEQFGVPVRWSEDEYAEKLAIGGGKERMASVIDDPALVLALHKAKTATFTRLVAEKRVTAGAGAPTLSNAHSSISPWPAAISGGGSSGRP